MVDIDHYLSVVCALAREAGAAILATRELHTQAKNDGSPVTAADLAANKVILDGLRALAPEIIIISEESLDQVGDRTQAEYVWLVDPLDGTSSFVEGGDDYTVNIALIQNGSPIIGAVYAPVSDTLYSGAIDRGAWKQVDDQAAKPISGGNGHTPPVVARSHSHLDPRTAAWLEKFGDYQPLALSSSLKLCYVADGTADLYPRLGASNEWDNAAGDAVVRAAGGVVIDVDTNEPVAYNKPDLHASPFVAARNHAILTSH
jgi:3'(2'), 5'-bisphosphate nucleotidase